MNSSTSPALRSMRTICTTTCTFAPALVLHPREPHEVVAHFLEARALAVILEGLLRGAVEAQRHMLERTSPANAPTSARRATFRWSKAAWRCCAGRNTRSGRRSRDRETARPVRSASCARRVRDAPCTSRVKIASVMSSFGCLCVSRGHIGQYRLHFAVVSTMYSTGSPASFRCPRK